MTELYAALTNCLEGNYVTMQFDGADMTNYLLWHEEGSGEEHFRVECPATDFLPEKDLGKKDYVIKAHLYRDLPVVVKSIDAEKNLVTVSIADGVAIVRKNEKREMLKRLRAGEEVIINGLVMRTVGEGQTSFAVIRPLNSNLRIHLPVQYWSTEYTDDINDVVKKEQYVEGIKIIYDKTRIDLLSNRCDFMGTRIPLLDNPWENADGKIHPDDIVTVTVTGTRRRDRNENNQSRPGDMSCIINGLNIGGFVSTSSNIRLSPGLCYRAIVRSADIKHRKVRLLAIGLVDKNVINERELNRKAKGKSK